MVTTTDPSNIEDKYIYMINVYMIVTIYLSSLIQFLLGI